MKLGMRINYAGDFRETVAKLADFEDAGVDRVIVPEVYGFDAVSQMGYIAAKTTRIELAFGILPMYTRTPTTLAMTAAGIDYVSEGRCVLGIGASGPQVIEGFHGVKYDSPLGRAREHVEICRKLWRREKSEHRGNHYTVPLGKADGGSGLGKPLRLINRPVRENIPIMLAAIGPKNVELAAEIFDEWQPFLFHPDKARDAFGKSLESGKAKRDKALGGLGIVASPALLISDDDSAVEADALETMRSHVALYVGGMGARGRNFYNDLMVRYGYDNEAKTIQDLYLEGKKSEAAAAVPIDFVREISLIGPASYVKERIEAFGSAGVTCLVIDPLAANHCARVAQLAQLKKLLT
jgi:F420-dependent oxidoreductase-like protein